MARIAFLDLWSSPVVIRYHASARRRSAAAFHPKGEVSAEKGEAVGYLFPWRNIAASRKCHLVHHPEVGVAGVIAQDHWGLVFEQQVEVVADGQTVVFVETNSQKLIISHHSTAKPYYCFAGPNWCRREQALAVYADERTSTRGSSHDVFGIFRSITTAL